MSPLGGSTPPEWVWFCLRIVVIAGRFVWFNRSAIKEVGMKLSKLIRGISPKLFFVVAEALSYILSHGLQGATQRCNLGLVRRG